MKQYIEYILLENFIVNYFVIYQLNYFTKENPKNINKYISILILSIYGTINYMLNNNFINNILIKLLIINIAVYIIYFPKKVNIYFKQIIYFCSVYFSYVGIIIACTMLFNIKVEKFYLKALVYIISFLILHLFNNFMWKMWKTNIKEKELTYKIIINGFEIVSFVDTGHNVKDYINNLDVIFIDKDLYSVLIDKGVLEDKVNLSFNTVERECMQEGYIVKNIKVKKEENIFFIDKAIVVFTQSNLKNSLNYKAIIGYDMYLDKLKGVTLC